MKKLPIHLVPVLVIAVLYLFLTPSSETYGYMLGLMFFYFAVISISEVITIYIYRMRTKVKTQNELTIKHKKESFLISAGVGLVSAFVQGAPFLFVPLLGVIASMWIYRFQTSAVKTVTID